MTENTIGSYSDEREGDLKVLESMRSHGADMSKPAHIIHYLYFKTIDSANAAANELRAVGFENLSVDRAPTTSIWQKLFGPRLFSCIAEKHAIPEQSAVFATTDLMNALAKMLDGEYDGWEASIEK